MRRLLFLVVPLMSCYGNEVTRPADDAEVIPVSGGTQAAPTYVLTHVNDQPLPVAAKGFDNGGPITAGKISLFDDGGFTYELTQGTSRFSSKGTWKRISSSLIEFSWPWEEPQHGTVDGDLMKMKMSADVVFTYTLG